MTSESPRAEQQFDVINAVRQVLTEPVGQRVFNATRRILKVEIHAIRLDEWELLLMMVPAISRLVSPNGTPTTSKPWLVLGMGRFEVDSGILFISQSQPRLNPQSRTTGDKRAVDVAFEFKEGFRQPLFDVPGRCEYEKQAITRKRLIDHCLSVGVNNIQEIRSLWEAVLDTFT